jgi:hypothetical protein
MNEDQFQRFLQVFSQSISQITSGDSPGSCNITPFKQFNPNVKNFYSYLEHTLKHFEKYMALMNMKEEEEKMQLLLASIGPSHYNLASFLGPENPENV